MYRIALLLLAISLFFSKSYSQCSETNQPKVLMVGDSWAFFMNVDQTINNAFKKWGFSNYKYITHGLIAENGAETDDFLKPDKQHMIDSLIKANPSIEVIHLSIGGNDVLGDWKVSFSQAQTDTLKSQVSQRLLQIIDFLKTTKPGIKILWSGYVYPNFQEVIQTSILGNSHPFYSSWQKMEFPTFVQLNTVLNSFSADVAAYAATDPQVDFINATGLMQYTFGQAAPLGVAPGGTYAAFTQPLPNGDSTYPSPKNSMRDYLGITKDCFHLSAKGYADLIEYHTQKFYHKLLMDDLYLLPDASQTGSVSSQGNIVDSLVLGEAFGESYSTVLSFDTRSMADTTLTSASVFLRRKSLDGANPISGNLEVKIKNGNFGASATVEASDYTATGDGAATPCLFGSNSGDGHWIRLDLPTSLFPFITKNDITQIVLSAPNFTGGKVVFNDNTDPEFAPVFNLNYGETPSSIEKPLSLNNFKVYPNPTNSILNIETTSATVIKTEIFNTLGSTVLAQLNSSNTIDVSTLSQGFYFINVTTTEGTGKMKFIKQ
jgi:lysophospholipase L1-like esterase